jgi:FHA domain
MNLRSVVVQTNDAQRASQSRDFIRLSDTKTFFTIGRSLSADVWIEDEYAAAMHVRIDVAHGGRLLATDLGSINGIDVDAKRHRQARDLPLPNGMLRIGRTTLRIRMDDESLPPEKPDKSPSAVLASRPALAASIGALFTLGQLVYGGWVLAPRDLTQSIVISVAIAAVCVALWVSIWAFLSRIMVGEWRWLRHSAIVLLVGALFGLLEGCVEVGRFSLGWPAWKNQYAWFAAATFGVMLHLHLIHASTVSWRRAAIAGYLIPVILTGGGLWFLDRSNNRNVNLIEAQAAVYPPQLRLSRATAVDAYFRNTDGLRSAAEAKLKAALIDDPDGALGTSGDD